MATVTLPAGPGPGVAASGSNNLLRLPTLLGIIAGTVEVIAYLMLGGLFTAHVTGNLVVIASFFARGGSPTAPQVLAVPVFIVATGAVWLVAKVSDKRGDLLVRPLLVLHFVLLVVVLTVCVVFHVNTQSGGLSATVAAAAATSAIACQFVLLRLAVPGAPSTAVMTGNLTNAQLSVLEMVWRSRPLMPADDGRMKRTLGLVVGFCGGCVAGAVAVLLLGDWAWALPVALAGLAFGLAPASRAHA